MGIWLNMNFTLDIHPSVELESTGFVIKITQVATTIIELVAQILDSIYRGA